MVMPRRTSQMAVEGGFQGITDIKYQFRSTYDLFMTLRSNFMYFLFDLLMPSYKLTNTPSRYSAQSKSLQSRLEEATTIHFASIPTINKREENNSFMNRIIGSPWKKWILILCNDLNGEQVSTDCLCAISCDFLDARQSSIEESSSVF